MKYIKTVMFFLVVLNTGCMNTIYNTATNYAQTCEKEKDFYDDPLDFYYNGFEMLYFK